MTIEIYSIGDIRADLTSVGRLFESNDTLGGINSRHIKSLENKFFKITNKNCVFVNSCTNGVYLALKKLNLKNDYVIVTPITFFGIISAIIHAGGIPLFTRVDKYGLMDISSIEELISKYNVRAIIPSHINNRYVNLENVPDIPVIEDSAPAFGLKRKDDTDILDTTNTSVISFSYGKPLTAGEGGMIILNNNEDNKWYLEQRFCGLAINGMYGYNSYDVINPEIKLTNNAISAALISIKLKSFEEKKLKAKKIAFFYDSVFGSKIDSTLYVNGNHQTFVILSKKRDIIMDTLNRVNVKSYLSHRPVYHNTAFKKYTGAKNYIETSEEYFSNILHIPCRFDLLDEDVVKISDTIKGVL